ncbi:hypothetical protein V6N11_047903 [Hibiscus sabdariffa]|uniref:Uncharacterized protein n=1 Tax=Hibiscus sabdariffa TaxID=183260 RepID=A0ABR2NX55_9ROSI
MTSTRRLRHNDHGVPHDLIEDILVKLSVKSLVRFNVPKDNKYEMLNSCDGILCFHGRFNIWVHNPATKECRLLPSEVRQVEEEDFPLWLLQTSPAPAAAATETMLNDNLRKISGPRRRRSNGGRWVVYIVCS